MKINHNISAVNTNIRLLRNESSLTSAMERLSSGYKLNRAADAPAGMAISNKMQAQIDALDQASRNSRDAESVLETADGALNELTSILQRMRELAVQAANDTNSDSDRDQIQTEIDQLSQEVDRISDSTEFNTKKLLDGSIDAHVYGDNASRKYVSSNVLEGHYKMEVVTAATPTTASLNLGVTFPIPKDGGGTMMLNGQRIDLTEGMTQDEAHEAIREGAERANITYDKASGTLTCDQLGLAGTIQLSASDQKSVTAFGLAAMTAEENTQKMVTGGKEMELKLDTTSADSAFADHTQATISYNDNRVVITDANGFKMSFKVDEGYTGDIDLEVTAIGPMDIQVGANARQQISVRIPPVSTENMYIDKINVRTHKTASESIAALDDAVEYINTTRAIIGSFSNRLEYTSNNTDVSHENMNAAISRIKDVDMAEEMTEFTKYNVLVQASTSALSQANEIPQMALQLIK